MHHYLISYLHALHAYMPMPCLLMRLLPHSHLIAQEREAEKLAKDVEAAHSAEAAAELRATEAEEAARAAREEVVAMRRRVAQVGELQEPASGQWDGA